MPTSRKKKAATPPGPSPVPAGAAPHAASRAIDNLERAGDRLKVYSLHNLLTNKRSPETRDMAKLGDVLLPWFEKSVARPANQLKGVFELWQQHVPPALRERCRLLSLVRGTLGVALDSTTVRAEFDAQLRGGLLRTLQIESRGAIYKIKTSVQPLIP